MNAQRGLLNYRIINKDKVYSVKKEEINGFKFDDEVAEVFDDMILRSVPFYKEMIEKEAQIAAKFYQYNTYIYDLGCSTGNLGMAFSEILDEIPFKMIGVDSSEPMIKIYQRRIADYVPSRDISLLCEDIRNIEMKESSVIIFNFTLQFIPENDRTAIIKKIYDSLTSGGILLMSEKITHEIQDIVKLHRYFYYSFKQKNGYSELEISQKREALEDVLIPEPIEKHQKRFLEAGFIKTDVWFKWFNFASFLSIK